MQVLGKISNHLTAMLLILYFLVKPYWFILPKTIKLIIIPKNEIDQLFCKIEKRLIYLLTIGLDFSLIITFKPFSEVIPQIDCFTLGEIFDSARVAIACFSITLIPLIYLLFEPAQIFSKYRKYEPNLIQP